MSQKEHRQPPAFIHSALRDHNSLALPSVIRRASGIIIMGRRMKSLIFTTDIAIIRNCNADAVLAVYPFTPQQVIMDAIISASSIPVVCGVGGGVTDGIRSVMLAKDAEAQGAFGVVVNAPMRNQTVETMKKVVDIPIIATVTSENYDIAARLAAGASVLNVSAAERTAGVVRKIREKFPDVPIIATGGPTEESILRTIEAGANAISYTPPSTKELFRVIMTGYREMTRPRRSRWRKRICWSCCKTNHESGEEKKHEKTAESAFDSAGGAAGGGHYLCGICDAEL